MVSLPSLSRPIVLAPMAGGIGTPELCAAVSNAGGLGFLPAGYRSAEQLEEAIARTRRLTDRPFGVNIFAPPAETSATTALTSTDRARYTEFRSRLIADGRATHVSLPVDPRTDDDDFARKVAVTLAAELAVVSMTFGIPEPAVMTAYADRGTAVLLTATTAAGVIACRDAGASAIVLQGPGGGGHRGRLYGHELADETLDLPALLVAARPLTSLPLIAAGGIAGPADVRTLLALGADAVQVGTLFLTSTEAGTTLTHRRALLEPVARPTVVTRAFTGRAARALENDFTREYTALAPGPYPAVHHLTSGIRKRAAAEGDPENLNLWAGTGYRSCREIDAAILVEQLAGG